MPSLNIENFGDLLQVTLSKYIKPDYVNLVTDLTNHPFAKNMIRKSRMGVDAGKNIDFKVKIQTGNSFRNITPTTQDAAIAIVDGFLDATVPWRKCEVKYSFLEEEMIVNRSQERIIDLIKTREDGAKADWIEGMESNGWSFPQSSDTSVPYSIPYWITKNATAGFNGGNPTGYANVAGIDATKYARWNNYTDQDVNTTLDDFVRKIRKMAERTDFKSIVEGVPDLGIKKGPGKGFYTNLSRKQSLEDLADSRNMNIGPDLAKYDNQTMFRKNTIEYAPFLDADTTNPFYQIDWGVFKMVVLANKFQARKVISPWPGRRNAVGVFIDTIYNLICFNRRMCGVVATGTTYPT